MGCDRHAPSPLIWRKGVPTESIPFENVYKRIKKEMKDYKANGDTQLTPTELLILRDYCMKENSPYHFMIYTIFIMFVKLFMRQDDGKNLVFEDFEESFFVVRIVNVTGLFCVCRNLWLTSNILVSTNRMHFIV